METWVPETWMQWGRATGWRQNSWSEGRASQAAVWGPLLVASSCHQVSRVFCPVKQVNERICLGFFKRNQQDDLLQGTWVPFCPSWRLLAPGAEYDSLVKTCKSTMQSWPGLLQVWVDRTTAWDFMLQILLMGEEYWVLSDTEEAK